ncbi:hypothetical protein QOZ80_5BG0422020 [Eleusine coracana subsp. coracana]|nr:hypothetical protein QOZ80_5BG0422020 [Eleusine coracana subsp. coracana]
MDGQFQVPIQVLKRRLVDRGGAMISQVLVQWSGQSKELATWEDEVALRDKFPQASAWGQAAFQGGKNVSTATMALSEAGTEGGKVRRGARARKPNVRTSGSEWA